LGESSVGASVPLALLLSSVGSTSVQLLTPSKLRLRPRPLLSVWLLDGERARERLCEPPERLLNSHFNSGNVFFVGELAPDASAFRGGGESSVGDATLIWFPCVGMIR